MNFKEEYKSLLEQIKLALKEQSLPSRNEDIAKALGYNRAYFSSLIGENGNITSNHLKILKLIFSDLLEKQTYGSMVSEPRAPYGRSTIKGFKTIEGDLPIIIGKMEEDLIRIDASMTILSVTLAEVISKTTGKAIGSVSVELSKAIDQEVDRLYLQLGKKRPVRKT